ncbi:MAG: HDOD domain-containing protein [Gemmatimonadaceae bacterium]
MLPRLFEDYQLASRQPISSTALSGNFARASSSVSSIQTRLSLILGGSDFPALSQQIIDTISVLDDDVSSLQRLANVVLREYSLTISVVRTANSAHYRRTGRPIQSATHAMMMLGARTVRHLASSLLLFENYARRSDQLKELMLLSLLTANHARETVARSGKGDPEEAHLCGMFRNLGEVLIACHFPDDYAAIQQAMHDRRLTSSGAANAVLGFRYEELGVALCRHWGMPEAVMTAMCARALSPLSEIGGITSFSHDLTRAIYRCSEHKKDPQQALDEVIALYAPRLKLSRAAVTEIVEAALAETRELFSKATADQGAALRKLSSDARAAMGEPAMNTGEWDAESLLKVSAADALLMLREKLRQELENKADPSSEGSLSTVILLALEGALRGGPFDRVLACVLNADRTQLTARTALGVGAEELMAKFDFPMTVRGGPVASALLQRQAVYLPTDRAMTAQEVRWANGIGCAQFGVFPIIVEMKIVGCLYVDRGIAQPLPDRGTNAYVKSLCELVARAIAARRGAVSIPAPSVAKPKTPAVHPAPTSDIVFQQVPPAWSASLEASIAAGNHTAESKAALVLRVLQGADPIALALSSGVSTSDLELWRTEFLAGALSRMQ